MPKRVENRVGDNVPPKEELDQSQEQLKAAFAVLRLLGVLLSKKERKSRLTPRRGSDKHIAHAMALARKYNINLGAEITPEAVERDMALYKSLEPIAALIKPNSQMVIDTYRQAGHEYWQGFLAFYNALLGAAQWNPEIAEDVESIRAFMATGSNSDDDDDDDEIIG